MSREKESDVMGFIRKTLVSGRILQSSHALQRMAERGVIISEIIESLGSGRHVKKYDQWDEHYEEWNYVVEGKTIDGRKLRVVVALKKGPMTLVITAFEPG